MFRNCKGSRISEIIRRIAVLIPVFLLLAFNAAMIGGITASAVEEGTAEASEPAAEAAAEALTTDTTETATDAQGEAASEASADQTAEDEAIQPDIHTVLSAWDVLKGEESKVSGSEEYPAFVRKYTEWQIDEEKAAEVERQEKEAEDKAKKAAEEEAEKMAQQLVDDRMYYYFTGWKEHYFKGWSLADYEEYHDEFEDSDEGEGDEYDDGDDADEEEEAGSESDESDPDEDDADDEAQDDEVTSADEETDTDEEASADEDTAHDYDPLKDDYLEMLGKEFPNITEFWFEEDGTYYFDYAVNYEGIDYSSMYIEIPHDTFHVTDLMEYKGFKEEAKYTVKAQLVLRQTEYPDNGEDSGGDSDGTGAGEESETGTEADTGTEAETETDIDTKTDTDTDTDTSTAQPVYSVKEIIKEVSEEFTAGEGGEGELELDFGELKADYDDYYVITMQILDENGDVYAEHSDLTDNFESMYVMPPVHVLYEASASVKSSAKAKENGKGFIRFPERKETLKKTEAEISPETGDDSEKEILIYSALIAACVLAAATIIKNKAKGDYRQE